MNSAASSHNAASLFHDAAERFPDRVALKQDGEQVTFAVLLKMVQTRAGELQQRGIQAGSKVLVFVPMSIPLYRDVLALLYLGACPVFLDQWVSRARLKVALQTVPPDAMIAPPMLRTLSFFIAPLRRIPKKFSVQVRGDAGSISTPASVPPEATALVTFTTGTTGTPKAADRTHAFLRAQHDALKPHLDAASGPVLTLLPIVVLINLAMGLPTILPPKGFKASTRGDALMDTLEGHSPETIVGSPAPVIELARLVRSDTIPAASSVRHILTGGGAVWPDEAADLMRAFPQADVRIVYGSTEAEPISSIAAEELAAADAAVLAEYGLPVGRMDKATRVAIISPDRITVNPLTADEWQALQLPLGSVGEIAVAGAHVLKSYLANPAAVRRFKVLMNGEVWHRTGDLGMLRADGHLFLQGRHEDTIWICGKVLQPMIAERLFRMESGAQDAALALTDKGAVMAVVAGWEYDAACAIRLLKNWGLEELPIHFLRRIPKDPRHRTKVDRATLIRLLA